MRLRSTILGLATLFGAVTAAHAGVGNAFTFATPTMKAVSDQVTYATTTPALVTYIAYEVGDVANNVLVTNTSGATANHFTLKFTATVVKPDGSVSSEKLTGLSIAPTSSGSSAINVSSACSFDNSGAANPLTVVCNVQQLKNGDKFPAFIVFYKAPSSVDSPAGCAGSLTPLTACNTVKTQVDLSYAEGMNDVPTGFPNSTQTSGDQKLVSLGTANPKLVKSAMPESGITLSTGVDAIPAPLSATTYPFASKVTVPPAPIYSSATIQLSDPVSCGGYANFTECYTADVTIPGLVFPVVPDPTAQKVVKVLLRIASALVKNPFNVANVQVLYTPDPLTTDPAQIFACQAGQPNNTTPHCIASLFRYSNAGFYGDLRGVVEVEVWGLSNGRFGIQ